MNRSLNLHDQQLKARIDRLINGDLRPEDVAKLYVGKRSAAYGRSSFRELADFAAHPDRRDRGPVADRIRDMRTTFKPMIDRALNTVGPSEEAIFSRAESNFRMATDDQVSRLSGGRNRKEVETILAAALDKMRNKKIGSMTQAERLIALNFGDRVIWNPALRAQEVFDDFKHVMIKNRLMSQSDSAKLDRARAIVVLHAVVTMHGTEFGLGDEIRGTLQAGFDNRYGCLEVTFALHLPGYAKPVSMKLGMFWTDLRGVDHVAPSLTHRPGPWDFPIEICGEKLHPMEDLPAVSLTEEDRSTRTIDFP